MTKRRFSFSAHRRRNSTDMEVLQYIDANCIPVTESGCFLWLRGVNSQGYGSVSFRGKTSMGVHRVRYILERGDPGIGIHLDHKCRVRSCCNPAHLDPVTPRINILRGEGRAAKQLRQTHCKRGHELAGENLYAFALKFGKRYCRICRKAKAKAQRDALRG